MAIGTFVFIWHLYPVLHYRFIPSLALHVYAQCVLFIIRILVLIQYSYYWDIGTILGHFAHLVWVYCVLRGEFSKFFGMILPTSNGRDWIYRQAALVRVTSSMLHTSGLV